jgi:FADH2 O2-dependent halogenase
VSRSPIAPCRGLSGRQARLPGSESASLPSVRDQFRGARTMRPFVHAPRLAFRSRDICGRRWALLPSAAGVIDPLLSTGFPLTLLGIARLLDVLENTSDGPQREAGLRAYAQAARDELDATERLVAALFANMADAPLFKRLALLYFAAASYAETAWRLGRRELAPGFLLHAHPRFGPELRECSEVACQPLDGVARSELFARIDRSIEPFDVAGLLDRSRRDWYPVLARDLMTNASKLDASLEEIERLLQRCGFIARELAPIVTERT